MDDNTNPLDENLPKEDQSSPMRESFEKAGSDRHDHNNEMAEEDKDKNEGEKENWNLLDEEKKGEEVREGSFVRSRSRSRSGSSQKLHYYPRYKFHCCDKCKKNDKNGKTCVCVVPANQRKIHLGFGGCKTCGCKGCTKEDLKEREELMRNGCCKKCMKAFSRNQKACLCQVPKAVRKQPLPSDGCNYCGCNGCNPEDTRYSYNNKSKQPSLIFKQNKKLEKFNKKYTKHRHHDRNSSRSPSESGEDEEINEEEMNFNNFDKSSIGGFISTTLNIFPPLIGFGIPQRTASYILGKPSQ